METNSNLRYQCDFYGFQYIGTNLEINIDVSMCMCVCTHVHTHTSLTFVHGGAI